MNMHRDALHFRWWHELGLFVLLLFLLATAEILLPGFLDWKNQLYLSRHLWEFAILALGMTLIIITGGIDLSIGSAMGLCAVSFGIVFQRTHQLVLASLASVVVGSLGGAVNGLLIARYRVHPLIVTLATFAAFRGLAEGISQGAPTSQFGSSFAQLARGSWLGVPWPGYLFLVLAIGSAVWLAKTPTGRFLYAIGHNERAAWFSGIRVAQVKGSLYTASGFLAGLVTVIYVSRFDTAKADAGRGLELDVITAVVVGGTSIFGGRGNIAGTTLGLLLIHEIRLFVSRFWGVDELKPIVIGTLLVVSMLAYRFLVRRAC